MIERLLLLSDPEFKLHHVRMDFSQNTEEIGKVRFKKVYLLASLVFRIFIGRLTTRSTVLYYPPGGASRVPIYRDIVILCLCRWMFKSTVFHFHAGGLSEIYPTLSALPRFLFRLAFHRPDASILISSLNPEDGKAIHSKRNYVIPNGLEDGSLNLGTLEPRTGNPRLLYLGKLSDTKGVLVLLDACRILKRNSVLFTLDLVGAFESLDFQRRMKERIAENDLSTEVRYLGEKAGREKFKAYGSADIFCFPTYYEAETFGLVAIEAMSMSLPVVATRWRGVPSAVSENESAFLVPIKDSMALAEKIEILIRNPDLRATMGKRGREIFERDYTLAKFHQRMSDVFRESHG